MRTQDYKKAEKFIEEAIRLVQKRGNKLIVTSFVPELIDVNSHCAISTPGFDLISYFVLFREIDKYKHTYYKVGVITKKEVEQGYSIMAEICIGGNEYPYKNSIKLEVSDSSDYYPIVLDLKEGPEIFVRNFNKIHIKNDPVSYFILKVADMRNQDYVYDFRDELVLHPDPMREHGVIDNLTGKEIVRLCKTLDYEDLKSELGVDESMWFKDEVINPEIWMTTLINKLKSEKNIDPEDFNRAVIIISNIYSEISRDYFGE